MATNAQILEALWGLGYSEAQLRAISTSGGQRQWLTNLLDKGIRGEDIDRAVKMADWRVDAKRPLDDQIRRYLRDVFGFDQAGLDRFGEAVGRSAGRAGARPGVFGDLDLAEGLRAVLNPQQFTQALIKLGRGDVLQAQVRGDAPLWNPLRGDAPPAPVPVPGGVTRGVQPAAPPAGPAPPKPGEPGFMGPTIPGAPGRGGAPGGGAAGAPTVAAPAVPSVEKLRADASPEEARKWIRQHYGSGAWMLDDPAVFDIVTRYAKGQLGDRDYQAELGRTSLFRTTNTTARAWRDLAETDPGNAASQRASRLTKVNDSARALGISLKPERARQIAEDSLRHGWDDAALQRTIGYEYDFDPSLALSGVSKQLADLAKQWGVPLSDRTRDSLGEKLAAGDMTIKDVSQTLANQAKGLYPHLAPDFDRGITYDTLISPYLQDAAKTLDVDVNTLEPDDPKWSRALNTIDPKTGQATRLSRWDWTNLLKTDDVYGWDSTAQGRAHGAQLAQSLAKLFGR